MTSLIASMSPFGLPQQFGAVVEFLITKGADVNLATNVSVYLPRFIFIQI